MTGELEARSPRQAQGRRSGDLGMTKGAFEPGRRGRWFGPAAGSGQGQHDPVDRAVEDAHKGRPLPDVARWWWGAVTP